MGSDWRGATTRLFVASLANLCMCGVAHTQALLPPYLDLRVSKAPTFAPSEVGSVLAYELHVTNFAAQPITLRRVDVYADDSKMPLFSLADSALFQAITRVGPAIPAADRLKIGGGLRAVVFLWIPVTQSALPKRLSNHVVVESLVRDTLRTQELASSQILTIAGFAKVIGPPLRGGVWRSANGPTAGSGHRRSIVPIDGAPSIAQRFAIDYIKVNERDSSYQGDRLNNQSYYAEGNDALAVADGKVVAVKDGIPENIPGGRAVPITLETVGGNHVIIDIGDGRYAFYAHLQPGSITVKVGDHVKLAQVIGHVGNTGNSTEPHLHFHIMDNNSPLGSEGIPYTHAAFDVVGYCRTTGTSCQHQAAVTHHNETPLNDMLVRFP